MRLSKGHLEKSEFCAGKPVRPTVASGVDGAHGGVRANFSRPPKATRTFTLSVCVLAFHDGDGMGHRMLSGVAKLTGLESGDL